MALHWRIEAVKNEIKPMIKTLRRLESDFGSNTAEKRQAGAIRLNVGREIVGASLALAADVLDEVLIYRPFNPSMLVYLADEKILPKARWPIKSADKGFAAGLVPYDVRRSKIGADLNEEQIAAGQRQIDELIESGVLKKVALTSRRKGQAVIREGKEFWALEPEDGDEIVFVLADADGRRLVSDVDLFDVGRRGRRGPAEWSENMGWVTDGDRQTIATINLIFKKLHPGQNSPDMIPHGLEMRKPMEEGRLIDFPLHAVLPGVGIVRISRGPVRDPFKNLRSLVRYFEQRGYQFSPALRRELSI